MVVQPAGSPVAVAQPANGTAATPSVAPTPNAPPGQPIPAAQLAPQTANAGGLAITTSAPVLYRWSDGDWIARITVSVRNNGTTPVDVDRSSFRLHDWTEFGGDTTFPGHSTVNPGVAIDGDVAWYWGGGNPQPQTFVVNYAPGENDESPVLATRTFTPAFSPAPLGHGQVPNVLVLSLPVAVAQPALTFVHTDGDRAARVSFSLVNNTGAALSIPQGYFHASLDGTDGTTWGTLTSIEDPLVVAAGATASGTVGWYWSGAHGTPTTITFKFGPPNSPQVSIPVTLAAGPTPIQ